MTSPWRVCTAAVSLLSVAFLAPGPVDAGAGVLLLVLGAVAVTESSRASIDQAHAERDQALQEADELRQITARALAQQERDAATVLLLHEARRDGV